MIDLVLIPFAGGTSLIYDKWMFSSEINPIRIEYSGHGFRMKEPLYEAFEDMVNDVASQIDYNRKNDDIAVFGHSMGGLVTWDLVSVLLEREYSIKQLIISSCLPPHLFEETLYEEMATDGWLYDFLTKYSRVKSERMESRFFKKNIYPAIKNDYRLISIHKHEKKNSSKVNLACFYGMQDELMPSKGMECWEGYTEGKFLLKGFQGEHFYIEDEKNREEIIATIESLIRG